MHFLAQHVQGDVATQKVNPSALAVAEARFQLTPVDNSTGWRLRRDTLRAESQQQRNQRQRQRQEQKHEERQQRKHPTMPHHTHHRHTLTPTPTREAKYTTRDAHQEESNRESRDEPAPVQKRMHPECVFTRDTPGRTRDEQVVLVKASGEDAPPARTAKHVQNSNQIRFLNLGPRIKKVKEETYFSPDRRDGAPKNARWNFLNVLSSFLFHTFHSPSGSIFVLVFLCFVTTVIIKHRFRNNSHTHQAPASNIIMKLSFPCYLTLPLKMYWALETVQTKRQKKQTRGFEKRAKLPKRKTSTEFHSFQNPFVCMFLILFFELFTEVYAQGKSGNQNIETHVRSVCSLAINVCGRCHNQQLLSSDQCAPHQLSGAKHSLSLGAQRRGLAPSRNRHDAADRLVKAAGGGSREIRGIRCQGPLLGSGRSPGSSRRPPFRTTVPTASWISPA